MAILKEDMMRAYQRYKFPETLKEEQLEITLSILNKKHTFGVLPTGYGKSLCVGLPPLILDMVSVLQNTATKQILAMAVSFVKKLYLALIA